MLLPKPWNRGRLILCLFQLLVVKDCPWLLAPLFETLFPKLCFLLLSQHQCLFLLCLLWHLSLNLGSTLKIRKDLISTSLIIYPETLFPNKVALTQKATVHFLSIRIWLIRIFPWWGNHHSVYHSDQFMFSDLHGTWALIMIYEHSLNERTNASDPLSWVFFISGYLFKSHLWPDSLRLNASPTICHSLSLSARGSTHSALNC